MASAEFQAMSDRLDAECMAVLAQINASLHVLVCMISAFNLGDTSFLLEPLRGGGIM
jgi:hypothetical protein